MNHGMPVTTTFTIEGYQIVQYLGTHDSTTRRIMEEILAKEEEHADDLASMLATLDPTRAPK